MTNPTGKTMPTGTESRVGADTLKGTEVETVVSPTVAGISGDIAVSAAREVKESVPGFTEDEVRPFFLASLLSSYTISLVDLAIKSPSFRKLSVELLNNNIGNPEGRNKGNSQENQAADQLFFFINYTLRTPRAQEQDFIDFYNSLNPTVRKELLLANLVHRYDRLFRKEVEPSAKILMIKEFIENIDLTDDDKSRLLTKYGYPAYIALGKTIPDSEADRKNIDEVTRRFECDGFDSVMSDDELSSDREYYLSLNKGV
jgi:hypothetical protein